MARTIECIKPYLMSDCAALLMDFKSAKFNSKKIAVFPVCCRKPSMASSARCLFRAAMYTVALFLSKTCEIKLSGAYKWHNRSWIHLHRLLPNASISTSNDHDLAGEIRDVFDLESRCWWVELPEQTEHSPHLSEVILIDAGKARIVRLVV